MPYSKHSYSSSNYDESLYHMMNLSLGSCQGYSYETMMIQEALATMSQPIDQKKSNSNQIVKLQIGMSLSLTGIILILGIAIKPDIANNPREINHTAQYEQRFDSKMNNE